MLTLSPLSHTVCPSAQAVPHLLKPLPLLSRDFKNLHGPTLSKSLPPPSNLSRGIFLPLNVGPFFTHSSAGILQLARAADARPPLTPLVPSVSGASPAHSTFKLSLLHLLSSAPSTAVLSRGHRTCFPHLRRSLAHCIMKLHRGPQLLLHRTDHAPPRLCCISVFLKGLASPGPGCCHCHGLINLSLLNRHGCLCYFPVTLSLQTPPAVSLYIDGVGESPDPLLPSSWTWQPVSVSCEDKGPHLCPLALLSL